MENHNDIVRSFLSAIGENCERDGLKETPDRVARSWVELYSGYKMNPEKILSKTFDANGYDQMVVLNNCEFYSTCCHHLLPFYGKIHIGYIPGARVVGLSKLARLVECFSRRLQIQELLTSEIADSLQNHLKPLGVGVVVQAKHLCMMARGIQKQDSFMTTSVTLGALRDDEKARAEFMHLSGLK